MTQTRPQPVSLVLRPTSSCQLTQLWVVCGAVVEIKPMGIVSFFLGKKYTKTSLLLLIESLVAHKRDSDRNNLDLLAIMFLHAARRYDFRKKVLGTTVFRVKVQPKMKTMKNCPRLGVVSRFSTIVATNTLGGESRLRPATTKTWSRNQCYSRRAFHSFSFFASCCDHTGLPEGGDLRVRFCLDSGLVG